MIIERLTTRTELQPGSAFSPTEQPEEGLQTDALLGVEIEKRLWEDGELRSLEAGHMRVKVRQGVAWIYGHISKALNRLRAQEITLAVPGVIAVQNELVSDDELKARVAAALAKDKRTRPYIFLVNCRHGWIRLGGTVPDAETQAAAEAVAASVPQVRGVVGLPAISGQGAPPFRQAFQPEPGWKVYCESPGGTDEGSVQEIILDPCSRLVTHIVVSLNEGGYSREQKEVLLPVERIEFTRNGAVWLNEGTDFRALPDFNPSDYPLAPEEWQPPFPYEAGVVRWAPSAWPSPRPNPC